MWKGRIALIVGTRPQIVKSAPVYEALSKRSAYEVSIINTGQHYDYEMNKSFFEDLALPDPEIDLEAGSGSANEQIAKILITLQHHFDRDLPDLAIIPGDTNSALASGIACSKLGIRIVHLEAGCRSYDFRMSEEINRRMLDHIAHILLCPTKLCYDNLRNERVSSDAIENVGDTMLDSLLRFMPKIRAIHASKRYGLEVDSYAFMTLHRAENVDDLENLRSILHRTSLLPIPIVFPLHPRTRRRIEDHNLVLPSNVKALGPLHYFEALSLARDSKLVITDSGGLQKEAFWLGKPSLIMRNSTEWPEIVNANSSILVGSDGSSMLRAFEKINNERIENRFGIDIFGDGHASLKVVQAIERYMSKQTQPFSKLIRS